MTIHSIQNNEDCKYNELVEKISMKKNELLRLIDEVYDLVTDHRKISIEHLWHEINNNVNGVSGYVEFERRVKGL